MKTITLSSTVSSDVGIYGFPRWAGGQITRSGVSVLDMGKDPGGMPETIRVALVNDYEIVLEGLRAFLRPFEPEICVVEMDVKAEPQRAVDVTLSTHMAKQKRCVNARVTSLRTRRTAPSSCSASPTT
jgi:hypothetical protein